MAITHQKRHRRHERKSRKDNVAGLGCSWLRTARWGLVRDSRGSASLVVVNESQNPHTLPVRGGFVIYPPRAVARFQGFVQPTTTTTSRLVS